MSGEKKMFTKACKAIDEAYIIEVQEAKRNRCTAITEALTKAITDMIYKESDKIISEIKDDITDISIIEQITSADLYYRLLQSIRNPLENTDIEMGEELVESDTEEPN